MKKSLLTRFSVLLIVALSLFQTTAFAQCPVANTCSPAPGAAPTSNWIFGMGIFNVNVNNGAINNTTQGAAQGYQDYSCTIGASLFTSMSYPINIQTNPNVNENVKVWIDYNNDGSFHAVNELAFSSLNAKQHTGTFTIPATAVTNSALRMRVSADNFSSAMPTPCSTPQYSQVEDYRITVSANTSAPIADFSTSATTICSPTACFTDLSQNGPTFWLWNFGDPASGVNNTSTLQNPCHTFSAPGTYTISLTAINSVGADTEIKTNYVTFHNNVPVAAACTPNTINYCCGYGITNVNFGNGLLTNTSANGAAGYQDFTCSKSVSVIAGNIYPFALTSGSNPQDTRIYIDLNNNGSFADANEMVVQVLNQVNPAGNITIPGTTFINTPLRMRIVSDEIGSSFNSCSGIQSGQAEDYTIIIAPNPNPPVAQFTSNYATACDTIVQFTDLSSNAPTSWLWNFGDPASGANNTSTLKNPVHIYHNAGTYNVTLTATNSVAGNSITKTSYISVIKPCLIYCPSGGHNNNNVFISNVSLSNLNNASGQAAGGYSNFTSMAATLLQGSPATLSVTRGGQVLSSAVSAWIDYNRNGTFEASEQVMAVPRMTGVATASVLVPATAPLGSTRMRVMTSTAIATPTNPCASNQFGMEVEDYTVIIQTNQQPPIPDFTVASQISCSGIVAFSDNTINIPSSWSWNFGDPTSGANNTSTLQNPSHTYASTGQYTVTLITCNSFGCDTIVKTNYINYDPTNAFCTTVVMPANGTAPNATLCAGTVYDPGGQFGMYPNMADSKLTIAPANAATVSLTFSTFDLENNWDFLKIYDGPSINSPLIGSYTGLTLPNGGTITSTSSALTLHFTSDNGGVRNGFAATWSCTPVTSKPAANFRPDLTNICTGSVTFQDLSTNSPTSWQWNFGNGTTSTQQNPTATYATTTPGNYNVTLIACNSFGCDTIVKTNMINIAVPCVTYCASNGHNNNTQWIKTVNTGGINNTTGPDANGYGNYTYLTGNMMLASSNPITVSVGNGTGLVPYIAIWIDFNKDGVFQTTERVYNARTINNGLGNVSTTGTITIPGSAQTGLTRMRVIMTGGSNLTNPCITNLNQTDTEDYMINITPNTLPTIADFSADLNNICTGTVQFNDISLNGATSWQWNFGNGNTSTLQNPSTTYSTTTPGSYNVTLIACKNGVCDTITKANLVNITVPCLTYCVSNGHFNTNQWISNVTVGTINNTSGADQLGYGNYTYMNTSMMVGSTNNPFSVTLGSINALNRYVTVWIDTNKDGNFQSSERVYNAFTTNLSGVVSTTGNITVPGTAQTGFTRMRVVMGQLANLQNACLLNQNNMEVEDYTINITPNTLPVVADFTADLNNLCNGTVQFNDISLNGATSWLWNFGNGNTSTLQNPTATYSTTTPGSYTVTLTVCKNGVCNTVTKTNLVNITVPCLNYCASNGHNNTNQWIGNVTFGSIINPSGPDANAYGNYTYLSNNVISGTSSNLIAITLGNNTGPFGNADIWIDFNKDGIFQSTEKVLSTQFNGVPRIATGIINIPSNTSLGITRMRVIYSQTFNLFDPCASNMWIGETEDYAVNIQPNTIPPVSDFSADQTITCNGVVNFTDLSQNNPTSWLWNFGDGNTSTLQNPIHTYATQGTYNVTLTTNNAYGMHPHTKTGYITYSTTNPYCFSVSMPTNGTTVTRTTCTGTIYDDGGPSNVYSNNASGTVVIAPTGATTVSLTFSSFQLESCCDYVTVYDGPNTTSPIIGMYNGTFLPNNGAPIVSTGNALTVRFTTDNSVTFDGFQASWNCVINNQPPTPDFTVAPPVTCDGQVSFTDISSNNPTTWSWNFGDGNTSTLQNPTHTYANPGTYSVSLTAGNNNGSNLITKNGYILFDPNHIVCRTINMPTNSTTITTRSCTGDLFDDGGPNNSYSNMADGTVVIAPTGATSVSLTFTGFHLESCCDYVMIYDGPSTASPLLGMYNGTMLPNNGLPITSSGGALTVRFITDGSGTFPGFAANWTCRNNVGIPNEGFAPAAFEVYPNPSAGMVNLRLNNNTPEDFNLEVTNVLGQVLMRKEMSLSEDQAKPLDLRSLAKGVYFIKIQNSKTSGVRRIVLE
ncbi:PKD domain-containing protein [Adhaeribacter sp. BT258]|uniref:PKD domain-containing protein n=1 Tax=Adhaeribacter terrigena TaxID=2793070 RepID=A0ABS1C5B9_9BACT|nr:PKD domain-containing protein [Adhaeribacter terrigena]MBK0404565.1 PKD domain-containing protein [Adhaeribacter terrigena]